MQLADFEKGGDDDFARLVTRVADTTGAEDFELRIGGPEKVVEQMFADATVDLTIDPKQDETHVKREFDAAHSELRRSLWELAALEDVDALLKPSPPPPTRETSVFVA